MRTIASLRDSTADTEIQKGSNAATEGEVVCGGASRPSLRESQRQDVIVIDDFYDTGADERLIECALLGGRSEPLSVVHFRPEVHLEHLAVCDDPDGSPRPGFGKRHQRRTSVGRVYPSTNIPGRARRRLARGETA